ncbi:variable surface protein Vir12-related [Plasmodium vivax]|uniref:Variable surface protein Vir12-related n=1 Tax=Plasmodium vivax (strain Salvador I) TaxID=126793 RepID=A5KCX5_PLAVS|nr:variable surface protein Vir12-related [Plasmodium vivax]EDL42796.1 variable surface protein Vir12-related [Plasmodium vivax]|eukprot:XP_001612587.1 variable surface protein Vir12-related [Plasmodium vivax Sal-1]
MTKTSEAKLEDDAKQLGLDKLYDQIFSKDGQSNKLNKHCDVFNGKDKEGVKKLCTKFVYFLEKIAEVKGYTENNNHCSYMHYWLYDEIGKIHNKEHSKTFGSLPWSKEFIEVWRKVNSEIKKNTCTINPENGVSVDELIKRKLSFIYLKKFEDIKKITDSKDQNKCKYKTYLTNISPLYKKYNAEKCKSSWIFSSDPNYADCSSTSKYDPNKLIPKLNDCKGNESTGGGNKGNGSWFFGLFGPSAGSSTGNRDRGASTVAKSTAEGGDKRAQDAPKTLSGSPGPQSLTLSTSARGSGIKPAGAGVDKGSISGPSANLKSGTSMSPQTKEIPVLGIPSVPPSSETVRGTVAVPIAETPSNLGTANEKFDSSFYRNIIMGVAILGTIFFLFYYNMSSGLKSRFPKRKRKKKIFERNYYEEYEKELARYDSENESLDSQSDRYYLNYQPDEDSYY